MRQWRVWRLLVATRTPLSADELVRGLNGDGSTGRTVRRDLEVLRELGAPVQTVGSGRDVRYTCFGDGPPLRLDADALLGLRLALGFMRPFEGSPVSEVLDQLGRQLEALVPARLLEHFRPCVDELVVRPGAQPSYATSGPVLQTIRDALEQQRAAQIDYQPLAGASTTREVHPQSLVWGPKGLYLHALDATRDGELRTFRVERVVSARLTRTPLLRAPGFDPEEHLAGSLGIHSPEHPPREVVLRLYSEIVAKALGENPWHALQRIEAEGDGRWRMTLTLSSTRELVSRVLALGPDAELLEPLELREQVGSRSREAASRYATSPAPAAGHGLTGSPGRVPTSRALAGSARRRAGVDGGRR